jgi:hypothetical protein
MRVELMIFCSVETGYKPWVRAIEYKRIKLPKMSPALPVNLLIGAEVEKFSLNLLGF